MQIGRRHALAAAGSTFGAFAGCLGLGSGNSNPGPAGTQTTQSQTPGNQTTTEQTTEQTQTTQQTQIDVWPQFQNTPAREGRSPTVAPTSANREWSTDIDGTVVRSPVVGEEFVFLNAGGTVYALDRTTGAVQWRATGATGPPAVVGDRVIFSAGSSVEVVAAASGERQRRLALPARAVTGPAVADGDVYVGAADERVHALTLDGTHKWQTVPLSTAQFEPVCVGETHVYIGTDLGLYVHDRAGGYRAWSMTKNSVTDSPTYADGSVFFGTTGNYVARYTADGDQQWRRSVDGLPRGSVAVGDGAVYAVAGNATLYRLNAAGGGVAWTAAVPTATDSSPVVADNAVLVNDEGRVRAYVPEEGGTLWTGAVNGVDDTACAVADGTVFAGGVGQVAAFVPEE